MNTPQISSRFVVLTHTCNGPMVSYWDNWQIVVDLLCTYNHDKCAPNVSVWQRKSAKGRWTKVGL